jgi:ATP-dependent DNA ligase
MDGFRGLLWRRGETYQLLRRNLKDLTPWFPELAQGGATLPPDTVLDSEILLVTIAVRRTSARCSAESVSDGEML